MKKPTYDTIIERFESGEIRGFYDKSGERYALFRNSFGGISYYKGRSKKLGYAFTKEMTKNFSKYILTRKNKKLSL